MPEVFVNRVTQDSSFVGQTGLAVEIDDKSKGRITGLPLGSGDLSLLRPYFSFHGGLSLQTLQISREGHVARVRPPFLYTTAQSRASRLPSISIASHFSAWPT